MADDYVCRADDYVCGEDDYVYRADDCGLKAYVRHPTANIGSMVLAPGAQPRSPPGHKTWMAPSLRAACRRFGLVVIVFGYSAAVALRGQNAGDPISS